MKTAKNHRRTYRKNLDEETRTYPPKNDTNYAPKHDEEEPPKGLQKSPMNRQRTYPPKNDKITHRKTTKNHQRTYRSH
ncbi:hypothetical protein C2G38_2055963 [Gigaspora rosea]|uniref:Uncharacterized protein n=1 Tax=Gigaspora rosea TaxID=44941 RepID=A0A397W4Y4_9GLOM|nr:hypothetical protein C2G38_2055963 [Gigaspora rosea]